VSLLWPDTVSVGLFPGESWLRRGRTTVATARTVDALATPEDLLVALQTLLAEQGKQLRQRDRVNLVVSDSVGVLVALPWQEQLIAVDELQAYGFACFEQRGVAIDHNWVMQTGFRQYSVAGIAYAIPRDWLQELMLLLETRGLRLGSVLPVSAAAFWQHRPPKAGRAVLLQSEMRRVTSLVYQSGRFIGIDVEPVITDRASAGKRLLKRLAAAQGDIGSVGYWQVAPSDDDGSNKFISACLPDTVVHLLKRDIWS